MQTYSRDQLVSAMAKYNSECLENPTDFTPIEKIVDVNEAAVDQVDHLLSLVEIDSI